MHAPLVFLTLMIFFSPRGGCTKEIVSELSRAKKTVQVQAFAFTSEPIALALIAAKKRGADVRVLLDRSWPTAAARVEAELVAAGIPVLIDKKHPIAHNKVWIIDGKTTITGSFNATGQAENNAENLLVIHEAKVAAIYAANWEVHAAHSVAP